MTKNVKYRIISIAFVFILCFSINIIPAGAEAKELAVGGEPFGLKLYCNGVMITRLEDFNSDGEKVCPAKDCGLYQNDIITVINGEKAKSNEQVEGIIKSSKGKTIDIEILRNNKHYNKKLKAYKNENNEYYAGMWVRDSCAGIGTISFYDTENKVYGALGHGICDIDTGAIIQNSTGEILKADINSVTKSEDNQIGSLNGIFTSTTLGTVFENSPLGIYGNIKAPINKKKYEIASESEVATGKAKLITTVEGSTPKEYDIEITRICSLNENTNRNMTVKITDKRLLDKTGGIVQGMSGSPIIQNNKIIGALTHVFLENCREGYAIYIGNMLHN